MLRKQNRTAVAEEPGAGPNPTAAGEEPSARPNPTAEAEEQRGGVWTSLRAPPLPPLGKVAQKEMNAQTFEQHWVGGIQQNLVFIGHGRQGNQAAQRNADMLATASSPAS